MVVVAELPAGPQAAEPVEVGKGALDDPALGAQPGAMLDAASCDHGLHTEVPVKAAVPVVVVAAVGENEVGAAPGAPAHTAYRGHRFRAGE